MSLFYFQWFGENHVDTEQLQSTIRLLLGLQKMRGQFSNFLSGTFETLKKHQRPQRIFAYVCYIYLISIYYINLFHLIFTILEIKTEKI